MRTNTALATLLLLTASLIPAAPAHADERARLRLVLVDETNAPLANATVMVFTLDGELGRTITTDERGVATVADLPVGLAEIYAKSAGYSSYAQAARLQPGHNAKTVTLESRKQLTAIPQSDEGGS